MSESSYYECCGNFGTHTAKCSRDAAARNCTKGVTPGGILLEELDRTAQTVVDELFPQDSTAASSVLGDTCPRCGGQLEHHEGLERDYPSCPRCQ